MTEALLRGSGVALWRQIAEALRTSIETGELPAGSQLPTEAVLSARYSVNRHTVRRAISALVEMGAVTVTQGRGTFVTEDVINYRIGERTRFSANMARLQRHGTAKVLSVEERTADAEIAAWLALPKGSLTLQIRRLSTVEGRPLAIGLHIFDLTRLPLLADAVSASGSITAGLKACGIEDYRRQETRVICALPTVEEATLLRQPANQPVLYTESLNVDEADRPLEVTKACYAGHRVQLVFDRIPG